MMIKTYLVDTIEEVEEKIHAELGPNAVILTSRHIRPKGLRALFSSKKIEVTAAIEEEDLKEYQQKREDESLKNIQDDLQEVSSHPEEPALNQSLVNERGFDQNLLDLKEAVKSPQFSSQASQAGVNQYPFSLPQVQQGAKSFFVAAQRLVEEFSAPPEKEHSSSFSSQNGNVRELVRREITEVLRERGEKWEDVSQQIPPVGSGRFLISKGVSPTIALEIEKELDREFGAVDMSVASPKRAERLNALKQKLAFRVKTNGPISLASGKSTNVALVGPTGVGKTVTLIKLACQYTHTLKKKVAVISLDTFKVGAEEQFEALAKTFHLPFDVAKDPKELQEALSIYRDYDLVLIDTSGKSQYRREDVDELASTLSTVEGLHVYLAISATTKDLDAYGIIQQFSPLNIESIIFTKLDETIAYGVFVNICEKTQQSISYLTTGQRIPEDLKIADSEEIARNLLMQHNASEFAFLRRMAIS